ncbi:MAG TPA: response regulator [Thermoanaerobaculia bacterium]|jgi:DNA-binding response OmpR family regulator
MSVLDLQRPRVLVVEDDPGIRSLMLAVVRRGGFEADTVANGIDAIATLAARSFSTIVLDLLLPHGSGYDVLEWMQESNPALLSRVIILSATSPMLVRKHTVAHRVFRLMQKPFDIEELLEVIRACVDHDGAPDPFLGVRMKSSQANAEAAVLGVVRRDPAALHLVWSYGYEDAFVTQFNPLALSVKSPLGVAVLEARPVWIRSRGELVDQYPALQNSIHRRTHAAAAAPIVDHGVVTGSIGWRFNEEQAFDKEHQELLLSIAAECAALSRTTG